MTQGAASLRRLTALSIPRRFVLDVRHQATQLDTLANDVRVGLGTRPKSLPPKHFYDAHGSQLFERICDTSEYYPTRTEQALLDRFASSIIDQTKPACIVELGSGSERKVSSLLAAVEQARRHCTYVPFDVSHSIIEQSGQALHEKFPWLHLHAIVGDYDKDLDALPRLGPTLFMFLGGTIGNFNPMQAKSFLTNVADHMGADDHLLLGTDLVKSTNTLNSAYNDSQGITADFNKNVLRVINHRLGGDFNLDAFRHVAFFHRAMSQIEMYLEASSEQSVHIEGLGMDVEFREGERILTEISRKFTQAGVQQMLSTAGLRLKSWFEPPNGYFGLSVAKLA